MILINKKYMEEHNQISEEEKVKHILETTKHINNVNSIICDMCDELRQRGELHDKSKLESPEMETFIEYGPKLKSSTYGSEEYKGFLKGMKVALDHHYSVNRHHPEHFPNGIHDMNIIDLIELLADWKAATLRHDNGDLFESIEINQKRFKYDDGIKQLLINSAKNMYLYHITIPSIDYEIYCDDMRKVERDTKLSEEQKNLIKSIIINNIEDDSIKVEKMKQSYEL